MTTVLSSYTLAQLRTDTQFLTGDIQGTRFSPTLLDDAVNYAVKQLVTINGYTYIERPIASNTTLNGLYNLFIFPLQGNQAGIVGTPAYNYMDYIEIRRVFIGGVLGAVNVSPYKEILKSTIAEEDMRNPNWRQAQGGPAQGPVFGINGATYGSRWTLQDGRTIVVTPPGAPTFGAGNAQAMITVGYVQAPPLLSDPADTVDVRIPFNVQQYIKYAAAAWLLSLDNTDTQSLNTAQLYQNTFTQLIGGS